MGKAVLFRGRAVTYLAAASLACLALPFIPGCGSYTGGGSAAAARPIVIKLEAEAAAEVVPLLQSFQEENPGLAVTWPDGAEEGLYDSAVSRQPVYQAVAEEILRAPGLTVSTPSRTVTLREERSYWFSSSRDDQAARCLASYLRERGLGEREEWTMHLGGDIIPGRRVAKAIVELGPLFPFEAVAPYMQGGDIVFANLEAPLSERYPPPFSGVDFIGPTSTIEGLKLLGLNLVNLANNHSTNFGTGAFTDTLQLLEANGIRYVGGGRDYEQAYSTVYMEAGGARVAFISYNCVLGSVNATPERPGVAWMDLPPYYQMNQAQVARMQERVKEARAEADLVVACFHWNEEYQPPAKPTISLAHAACEAGADLVVGSHPHCVQPLEFYGNSLIFYNLGNFVFDQMHRDITREGFMAHLTFQGGKLTRVELIPYIINDPCKPVPLSGSAAVSLSEKILRMSGL